MRYVTYRASHKTWSIDPCFRDRLGQALQARVPAGGFATELEAAESLGKYDSTSGVSLGMACILYSGCKK
jgi:hypothetical protein